MLFWVCCLDKASNQVSHLRSVQGNSVCFMLGVSDISILYCINAKHSNSILITLVEKKNMRHLKNKAFAILGEADFELHKCRHLNKPALESKASRQQEDVEQSYAKEQIGVKPDETRTLELP